MHIVRFIAKFQFLSKFPYAICDFRGFDYNAKAGKTLIKRTFKYVLHPMPFAKYVSDINLTNHQQSIN